jgi:hypothetical protein
MTSDWSDFAADVLRRLLQVIADENKRGRAPYLVSHAWTDGPMMYLVFTAPPSEQIWGLARDTRQSIIDPGPWPDAQEAARYYYLVDLQENQPSTFPQESGIPTAIRWLGYVQASVPDDVVNVPERHRQTTSPVANAQRGKTMPTVEPRRYGNRT